MVLIYKIIFAYMRNTYFAIQAVMLCSTTLLQEKIFGMYFSYITGVERYFDRD